jgi:hypothetical protein
VIHSLKVRMPFDEFTGRNLAIADRYKHGYYRESEESSNHWYGQNVHRRI